MVLHIPRGKTELALRPIDSLFHQALSVRRFTEMAVGRSSVAACRVKADYSPTAA